MVTAPIIEESVNIASARASWGVCARENFAMMSMIRMKPSEAPRRVGPSALTSSLPIATSGHPPMQSSRYSADKNAFRCFMKEASPPSAVAFAASTSVSMLLGTGLRHELLLRFEVAVEAAVGQACRGHYLGHTGCLDPLALKRLGRFLDNFFRGLCSLGC